MAKANGNVNNNTEVAFAQDLGLFDASMIGIGAMIGAGIFVLTGIAAGVAGPAALLAFILNGFVTLLTALSYAELASSYPQSGGGYAYIRKAFPGPVGFISGWMLWFCYVIACSLYALGFGSYFWEFLHNYFPFLSEAAFGVAGDGMALILVTVAISVAVILINMRGTALTGKLENLLTVAKMIILAIFIFYGLKQMMNIPTQAASSFRPFLPQGFSGVVLAMGLTFIAFEGYDLIATVAEEIKAPKKTIPRATMISLFVTIVFYLLIVVVCIGAIVPETGSSWEFLGKYQETAIVKAAESFMPFFGVPLIIFGGLLSTLSALNATILASSRVAFSMGRDKMLPVSLASIHETRRTPHIAVAVTGAIMVVMAILFPIHIIGSAASVMFLLTFALVNLSLISLRRKFPEVKAGFRVPLYPLTPVVAIVLNLALAFYQYNFDAWSWYIAIAWLLIGLFIYFAYFEKVAAPEMPQVLEVGQENRNGEHDYRILIPLHNPDHVIPLMKLAAPIAKARNGEIVVLGVIDVPQNLPIHEGMRFVHHKTPLLKEAVQYGNSVQVPTRSAIRIAHRVYDGILRTAEEEKASLILMGWKGYTTTKDRIIGEVTDKVVHHTPCDLITVKLTGDLSLDKILVPTAGGFHAQLAAQFVSIYQGEYRSDVTSCYVVPRGASQEQRDQAREWIEKTIQETELGSSAKRTIIEANKVASGLARTAGEYDLIVLGVSEEGLFSNVIFGEIAEKVARYSRSPVMIVKRYEGKVKSIVKKVLG
jgi:amino acid transporter/nucleotide-binding universal stress UspA family protein